MCEFGFGWPGLDTISLYNMGLPWFALGALGVGVPAKALAIRRIWGGDQRRLWLASLSSIFAFGVLIVWFPSHVLVWELVGELVGDCVGWCGWLLLLSAGVATALDAAVLRFGFRGRANVSLFAANFASLAAGYAVVVWYAIHNPPIA